MTRQRDDPRLTTLAQVLQTVLEFSGIPRQELARRLGSDYLMRRIKHVRALRVSQLFELADAIEMKPLELLRMALDGDDLEPSPLLRRMQAQSERLDSVLRRLNREAAGGGTPEREASPGKDDGTV